MDRLEALENKTIYLIREAYKHLGAEKLACLWSMGKDSTTLLWIIRKAFLGKVPFPVIHIDTSYKFKEMYAYKEKYRKEWNLDLLTTKNVAALDAGMNSQKGTLQCCGALKTQALTNIVTKNGYTGLFVAIRRDEHGVRAKENYFSPRNSDHSWDYKNKPIEMWNHYQTKLNAGEHLRIHPLLDWTELDIWQYIQRENIPVVSMYFAKSGKRYRSLGCIPCTAPVNSNADSLEKIILDLQKSTDTERSGRSQDKEDKNAMEKLRSLGYM